MRPDLSTFRVLPHVAGQARVICDMEYADGRPVEASPRRVLAASGRAAAARGLRALMQAEYEFYLLDAETRLPPFGGTDITTTLTNQRLPVLPELVRHLQALGLRAADAQPGVGADAVRAHVHRRWRACRRRRQLHVQDVREGDRRPARPARELHDEAVHRLSGSSSHLHMSLFDGARNIFWDATQRELTPEFGWAIGGLLEHAAALNALLGPTVNCAKRYRKGTYAPASVTWGFENRSVAMRVKAGRGDATHIEDRLGSAASNPYLALAGMLVAVLDGIARQVEPPPPLETSAYQLDDLDLLPLTLEDSLDGFEADEVLRKRSTRSS